MTDQPEIFIVEVAQPSVEINAGANLELQVVEPSAATIIEVSVPGPQGPPGPPGTIGNLESIPNIDATSKVDGSLLYFDGSSGKYKADSSITTATITDGGNF